jgi:hypothetical protein
MQLPGTATDLSELSKGNHILTISWLTGQFKSKNVLSLRSCSIRSHHSETSVPHLVIELAALAAILWTAWMWTDQERAAA